MTAVLRTIDRLLGQLELLLSAVALLVIAGCTATGSFFRSIIDDPLVWANEMSVLGLVWLTFLGSSAVYKERGHLAVDAFSALLPARARHLLKLALIVLMGLTIAIVGWYVLTLIPLQHRKLIPGIGLPRSLYGFPLLWMAASMSLSSILHVFDELAVSVAVSAAAGRLA